MENIHSFGALEKGIEGKKILEEIVAEKCSYLNSPKEFKKGLKKNLKKKIHRRKKISDSISQGQRRYHRH